MRSLRVLCIFVFLGLATPWSRTLYMSPSLAAEAGESQNSPQQMPEVRVNRPVLRTGSQGTDVSELQAALKLLGYYMGKVDGVYSESTAFAVSRFQKAAGLNPDGVVGSETWNRLFPAASVSTGSSSISPPANSAAAFPVPSTTRTTNSAAAFPVPSTTRTTSTNSKPQTTTAGISRSANRQTATTAAPRTYNRQVATTNTSRTYNYNHQPTRRSTPQPQPTSDSSTQSNLPILRLGAQGSSVSLLQRRLRNLGVFKGKVTGVFDETTQAAVQAAQERFKLDSDGVVGPATWSVLLR